MAINQLNYVPLIVVSGDGPSVFGQVWMMKIICLTGKKSIATSFTDYKLTELLDYHSTLFEPGLHEWLHKTITEV